MSKKVAKQHANVKKVDGRNSLGFGADLQNFALPNEKILSVLFPMSQVAASRRLSLHQATFGPS